MPFISKSVDPTERGPRGRRKKGYQGLTFDRRGKVSDFPSAFQPNSLPSFFSPSFSMPKVVYKIRSYFAFFLPFPHQLLPLSLSNRSGSLLFSPRFFLNPPTTLFSNTLFTASYPSFSTFIPWLRILLQSLRLITAITQTNTSNMQLFTIFATSIALLGYTVAVPLENAPRSSGMTPVYKTCHKDGLAAITMDDGVYKYVSSVLVCLVIATFPKHAFTESLALLDPIHCTAFQDSTHLRWCRSQGYLRY